MNEMTGLTPSQVYDLLVGHFKSGDLETVMYLEGHHGVGKTDIVLQAAIEVFAPEALKKLTPAMLLRKDPAELGFVFHREYPATKQVEDYTGVPFLDKETRRTVWGTPDFFPVTGKGELVFEELNQSTEEVLKAMFPMLQDKRIGSHILSPEVYLVVTGNPPNSIHHVADFPIALKDRMQRIGFVHSAKDWIRWAKSNDVHPAVVSFIEDSPTMLHVIPDDGSQGPTPRAWCAVSRQVYKLEKGFIKEYMLVELIKNRVGDKAATKFLGHLKNSFKRAVTAEELLEQYDKFLPRYKEQPAAGKAESIDLVMRWIETNITTLKEDSPQLQVIKDLFTNNTSNGILVAKVMAITQGTFNQLVQLGPNGVSIGQKLASIRRTAEQDGASKDMNKAK